MDDHQPDEETRLLGPVTGPSQSQPSPPPPPFDAARPGAWRTILSATAVLLIFNFARYLAILPQFGIVLNIVCQEHYARHNNTSPPSDGDCFMPTILTEAANFTFWKSAWEVIAVAGVAVIPYGALADRIGRKPVLLLAILGYLLSHIWASIIYWFSDFIPVRAAWASGLWQLIGGGYAAVSAISFTLVTDVCPVEQRTSAFALISAADVFLRILPSYLNVHLLNKPVSWILMFVALLMVVLAFVVALLLVPETIAPVAESDDQTATSRPNLGIVRFWQGYRAMLSDARRWAIKTPRAVVVLMGFFLLHLGEEANLAVLIPYAFGHVLTTPWDVTTVISAGNLSNLLTLAFIIPSISSFLLPKLGLHEMVKDRLLSQSSGLFLVIGSVVISLANSAGFLVAGQVLYFLGEGFAAPARSLMAGMAKKRHVATTYAIISALASIGGVAGYPIFTVLLRWGKQLGEFWTGVPFLVSAVLFLLAIIAVSFAPPKELDSSVE